MVAAESDDSAAMSGDLVGENESLISQTIADSSVDELNLSLTLSSPGTEPFNQNDDAGFATGTFNNGTDGATIVRVNDKVTYLLQVVANGTALDNTTVTVTFPKGIWLEALPGYCLDGSSLTPADPFENVTWPISEDVNQVQVQTQTLTCKRGSLANVTEKMPMTAKIGNLVPNGYIYNSPDAVVTGMRAGARETSVLDQENPPKIQASSRLMWNLSKNALMARENTGYTQSATHYTTCPWDSSLQCDQFDYPTVISAPNGGLGVMPVVGDASWVDDYSPTKIFPTLTPAQQAQVAADPEKYAPRLRPYNGIAYTSWQPSSYIDTAGTNASSAVRKSGAMSYSIANSNLKPTIVPGTVTLTGTDWSLTTTPTLYANDTAQIPAIAGNIPAYAVSLNTKMWIPFATIKEFGVENPAGTFTLPVRNEFTDFTVRGFDGAVQLGNYSLGGHPYDCGENTQCASPGDWLYRQADSIVRSKGTFNKLWIGVPGERVTPASDYWPNYAFAGPPGGAAHWSGQVTAAPTQNILAVNLTIISGDFSSVAVGYCDVFEPDLLILRSAEFPKPDWSSSYLASGGKHAAYPFRHGVDGVHGNAQWKFQYSAALNDPGVATSNYCGETNGPWFDAPEKAATSVENLADGSTLYHGVSRVRVLISLKDRSNPGQNVLLYPAYSFQIAPGLPEGTLVGNWASQLPVRFDKELDLDALEALADDDSNWVSNTSSLDDPKQDGKPTTPNSYFDWLTVYPAMAQVDKQSALMRGTTTPAWSKDSPPGLAGDSVWWRLSPGLTSVTSGANQRSELVVEDCLSSEFNYVEASLTPTMAVPGGDTSIPEDSEVSCKTGEGTYLRWELPDVTWNEAVEPIIVKTEISLLANAGAYTNSTTVSSPGAGNSLNERRSSAVARIAEIFSIDVQKTLDTPIVQINRDGQLTNQQMGWTNTLLNRLDNTVPDVSMIDVLPTNDGVRFDAAISTGVPAMIYYTKSASPESDPQSPSNGDDGSTVWCDAPSEGSVFSGAGTDADCPADPSEVTAVRWIADAPLDSKTALSGKVWMTAVGNSGGDTYTSLVSGSGQDFTYTVGPDAKTVVAVASSIGHFVWDDTNADGLWDSSEPKIPDAKVTLAGTDDLRNKVALETQTDSDGEYIFDTLRSGNYDLTFELADGFRAFTTQRIGSDDLINSAPNADGLTTTQLGANDQDDTENAGMVRPPEVALPNAGGMANTAIILLALTTSALAVLFTIRSRNHQQGTRSNP